MFALLAHLALAQDVPAADGQLWAPPLDARTTLWTEDSTVRADGTVEAAAWMGYAYRPLRSLAVDGEREVLLSDLWSTDLVATGSFGRFRLGADLPLVFFAAGAGPEAAGLGDIAIDLKGGLVDRREAPLGLALGGRLQFPTSSVALPVGLGSTGWELYGVVDHASGPWVVTGQLGTRGIPRSSYGTTVFNDAVFSRVGASYEVQEGLGASLDWALSTNFSPRTAPAGTASELLAGGFWQVMPNWRVRAGAGVGLGAAPGTAGLRTLASLAYTPSEHPDRDLDGLADREDRCPLVPEDIDEVADDDGCPDPTVRVDLRVADTDGRPVPGLKLTLDGPEHRVVDATDDHIDLHPGRYTMRSSAPGFETVERSVVVPPTFAFAVVETVPERVGTLAVRAVETDGDSLSAFVSVSGGPRLPADGSPIRVTAGEHAVVVSAPGHAAVTTQIVVARGDAREWTAILTDEPTLVASRPDRPEEGAVADAGDADRSR